MGTRPRRLVHLSRGLDVGGQEKLLLEFARRLPRDRYEQIFVSLTERGSLAPLLTNLGCRVLALQQAEGLRPGTILALTRLLVRLRPAIVHTHDDKPLLYGLPAARLAGVPRLIHTHHHGRLPHITSRQERLVAWAGRWTDRFVCVSRDAAAYLAELGVPRSRLLTLWNGIDLEQFPFAGPRASGPAVVVARLSPEKDLDTLLRAVPLLAGRCPDFTLEIAGDGPLRSTLEERSRTLGIAGKVRFLGEVRDVAALLERARLFVLPSRTEGISLTLLEAMARGLPVATTAVGGNPEVVADGETGLLVPPADPTLLGEALARLWHDVELRRRFGAAGRQRVERHFDIRKVARRYEDLYDEQFADRQVS